MLSVIITAFEQATSLEMLLYCLRAQEIDEPFEILICDDGSSSDQLAAIRGNRELCALDIRFIWQSKSEYRVARSRNNGVRCAKGDFLIFLDADILIKPTFLKEHRSAHHASRQIVCNPRRWVIESKPTSSSKSASARHSRNPRIVLSELAALAKNDLSALFELLERVSFDVDREEQQTVSLSKATWMACVGFSFSIDNSPDVYFDETFVGWGPEDREFALRMAKRHNYTVWFRDDIEVFHLENCSTGRPALSLLPKSPSSILSYLRNMIYFRALYPNEDLSVLMTALMAYRLSPTQEYWELASGTTTDPGGISPRDIATQVSCIEEWLRARAMVLNLRSIPAQERFRCLGNAATMQSSK
jgi:glycosyltransferase involved in cell wall biosynthesis